MIQDGRTYDRVQNARTLADQFARDYPKQVADVKRFRRGRNDYLFPIIHDASEVVIGIESM
jgi:hypothetical protein